MPMACPVTDAPDREREGTSAAVPAAPRRDDLKANPVSFSLMHFVVQPFSGAANGPGCFPSGCIVRRRQSRPRFDAL